MDKQLVAEELRSKDPHKLAEIASKIMQAAGDCRILLFDGEMGAGKTTLIRAISATLGVKDNVSSPTFSLVNEYVAPSGTINHFDFYRVKSLEEALNAGVEEYFYSGNLCMIEWPGIIESIIPERHMMIKIEVKENNERIYKLTMHGIE